MTPKPERITFREAIQANISFCEAMGTVRQVDIIAVLVAHSPFRKIPQEELMRRVVIDATRLTDQQI